MAPPKDRTDSLIGDGDALVIEALEGAARHENLSERAAAFAAMFPNWRRPWRKADFAAFADDPRVLWFEARRGAPDARHFAGMLLARQVLDEVELLTLFRAPDAPPMRIGTHLIKHLIRHATASGAARIILEVGEENGRALSLYRRYGFHEVGRRRGYYGRTTGAPEDALLLVLHFCER